LEGEADGAEPGTAEGGETSTEGERLPPAMNAESDLPFSLASVQEGTPMALTGFLALASLLNVAESALKLRPANTGRAAGISRGKGAGDYKEAGVWLSDFLS
jgi:hypothetical protein